jgi:hypothetical protein
VFIVDNIKIQLNNLFLRWLVRVNIIGIFVEPIIILNNMVDSMNNFKYMRLLFILLLLNTQNLAAQTKPEDIDNDGYLNISTFEHLKWVMATCNQNDNFSLEKYELDNDIDASESKNWDWDSISNPAVFVIGTYDFPYKGHFNGNGFSVKNLYLKFSQYKHIGFFGVVGAGGLISNLHLKDCEFYGDSNVGGLIGKIDSATIINSSFSGKLVGKANVGGLVGYQNDGLIQKSFANIEIEGYNCVGGMVGYNYSGRISQCFSVGNIDADYSVGGMVGYSKSVTIRESYTNVNLSKSSNTGGLIANGHTKDVENSFWNKDLCKCDTSFGGESKRNYELLDENTFKQVGWNMVALWDMKSEINNGYPTLNNRLKKRTLGVKPTDEDSDGYWDISSFKHLIWLSENIDYWQGNFELINDINASESFFWEDELGFSPIGRDTVLFIGNFEGNGFIIDSLYINRPYEDRIGLFGRFGYSSDSTSTIKNLALNNCIIKGYNTTGSLVGQFINGSILNCHVLSGLIWGSGRSTGGLVGLTMYGNIDNSSSNTIVRGNIDVGGLIGENNCTITRSYSYGSVFGKTHVGGFSGHEGGHYGTSSIRNCFTRSYVHGKSYIGGFCGGFFSRNQNLINCYSSSIVVGEKYCGYFSPQRAKNQYGCFYEKRLNSEELYDNIDILSLPKDSITHNNLEKHGWNFHAVWSINPEINDGYPFLNDRTIDLVSIKPIDRDSNGFVDISCFENLLWLSENPSSERWSYELVNDIDCGISKYIDEDRFLGIYSSEGIFEGNHFSIDNLYVYNPISPGFGVFSDFLGKNSEIRNLKLSNFNITGYDYVGSIAGYIEDCKLHNCEVTNCSIKGQKIVGSAAGSIVSSIVHNCSFDNKVHVKGNSGGGGFGTISQSIITNNSVKYELNIENGNMDDNIYNYGGLTGNFIDSYLSDCFAIGIINNTNNVERIGGLIGFNINSYIKNSYTVFINNSNEIIPEIPVGKSSMSGLTESTFFDSAETNISLDSENETIGLPTIQMKNKHIFIKAGWDFEKIWNIDEKVNDGYPFLRSRPISFPQPFKPVDSDNDGFFEISNYQNLLCLSQDSSYWNKSLELTSDIRPMDTRGYSYWLNIKPIGSKYKPFTGKFHGNGYIIDSLIVISRSWDDSGLFGNISGKNSEVIKLGISNAIINGSDNIGGVVGRADSTSIRQCHFQGTIIKGNNESSGGITGFIENSEIVNCYSNSKIISDTYWNGGIAGIADFTKIKNSYSRSQINQGGGLVAGTDTSWEYFNTSIFENCFWDKEISPHINDLLNEKDEGEIIDCGKTTLQMQQQSTFTEVGWNFDLIWEIDGDTNDGYPYLKNISVEVAEHLNEKNNVILYPNPANNILYLKTELNPKIKIYNLAGMIVGVFSGDIIDISTLNHGLYLAVIEIDGNIYREIFTKQ